MAISQNKLTPVLVVCAGMIVAFTIYSRLNASTAAVASGPALNAVPQPGVDPASAPKSSGGIFGGSTLPPVRSADADNSAETMAQVTASNKELRTAVQKVVEDNETLKKQNADLKNNEEAIVSRVRAQLQAETTPTATPTTAAGSAGTTGGLVDTGLDAASKIINGMGTQPGQPGQAKSTPGSIPSGLGYDGMPAAAGGSLPMAPPSTALTKVIAPLGYRTSPGVGENGPTLTRNNLAPIRPATYANPPGLVDPGTPAQGYNSSKPEAEPYYTIPENATLTRATAMTTLVGRVPIDGRVQDPMQFKLVIGRENLAASGQYLPDDISGIIVSGIAVGDMALSCTEGLIQSLTFVFDDGTIRTVSQRSNGASSGLGAGSSGGGMALASASKLGWISDEFGNPCVPGKFVTNAPAYLTDVVGAKALSTAGAAIAAAQTTTVNGASALGSTTTSTVTGSVGKNVLGKVASSGSDELVNWLTKRLNNSFDAVVVRAGTRVAVHIEQSISIDKEPEGRKLDYARGRSNLAQQTGARHGLE